MLLERPDKIVLGVPLLDSEVATGLGLDLLDQQDVGAVILQGGVVDEEAVGVPLLLPVILVSFLQLTTILSRSETQKYREFKGAFNI